MGCCMMPFIESIMVVLRIISIVCFYVIVTPVFASHCPVLNSYGSDPKNLFHGYPVDMLLPSVLAQNRKAVFRNCSDRNKLWPDVVTKCSTDMTMCAVTQQNVNTALSIADWPQYAEAFHRLNTAIQSKKPIPMNLFILGGSMTRGSCTFSACLCNSITESTCPAIVGDVNVELVCAWPAMLEHWITSAYPHIKVINLSQSGFTSTMMADDFADLLRRKVGLTSLNSDDIVMIDHSVNDFAGYSHALQNGFESLLRRILHLATNNTRPTIMVIEQYPLGSPAQIKWDSPVAVGRPGLQGSADYAATYRALSKHYGVISVSLREVFLTYDNYTTVNKVKTRMYPMAVTHDRHPPWWRHLFIADVLADTWLHIMARLQSAQSAPYVPAAPGLYTIPAPLYQSKHKTSVCDTTKPFLIDVRPNDTFTPKDVHAYETNFTTVSKAGWREYIDYHNTPGFIINSLSDVNKRVLSFPFGNRASYEGLLIKIIYLKSYVGMGKVTVTLCNGNIDALQYPELDALYHDHGTYKVSLPTEHLMTIVNEDNKRCLALPAHKRNLQIQYSPVKDDYSSVRDKNHQKFKLMAVELCDRGALI